MTISFRVPMLTTAVLACLALAVLAFTPTTWAATEIGQTDPGVEPEASCVSAIWAQSATAADPGYAVPVGGGVITSWSHNANAASGRELALQLVRPDGGDYESAGASDVEVLAAATLNSFSARIPVVAGDLLGIWVGNVSGGGPGIDGGASCVYWVPSAGDQVAYGGASAPAAFGATFTLGSGLTSGRVNVAAVVEPDADGDDYGDETQDACPTDAATQGSCPAPPSGGAPPGTGTKDPVAPAPRTLPKLTVSAPARQSLAALGTRRLAVVLRSDVATAAVVKSAVRIGPRPRVFRFVRAAVSLRAGIDRKLRIALPAKARAAAIRALGKGRRVRLRLEVTAVESDGDRAVVRHVVRLTP